MKYGRLTLLEALKEGRWRMVCDCGNEHIALASNIKKGATKSCGCLQKETIKSRAKTHGMSKSAEYMTWRRMWSRCTNPIVDRYPRYGGRGISVCDQWKSFEVFFKDIGVRPSPKHSLGRIDNNGNYEPGNVRWEEPEQQNYNKKSTLRLNIGDKSIDMMEAVKITGQSRDAIVQRIKAGMPVDKVLASKNLKKQPITVNGVTRLTTEWMRDVPIPISSFYFYIRKGMTPEQIVEKYLAKRK